MSCPRLFFVRYSLIVASAGTTFLGARFYRGLKFLSRFRERRILPVSWVRAHQINWHLLGTWSVFARMFLAFAQATNYTSELPSRFAF
jgi:hypothetical protein